MIHVQRCPEPDDVTGGRQQPQGAGIIVIVRSIKLLIDPDWADLAGKAEGGGIHELSPDVWPDGRPQIKVGEPVIFEAHLTTPIISRVALEKAVIFAIDGPIVAGLPAVFAVTLKLTVDAVPVLETAPDCLGGHIPLIGIGVAAFELCGHPEMARPFVSLTELPGFGIDALDGRRFEGDRVLALGCCNQRPAAGTDPSILVDRAVLQH